MISRSSWLTAIIICMAITATSLGCKTLAESKKTVEERKWYQALPGASFEAADRECKAAIARSDKRYRTFEWYLHCMSLRHWILSGGPSEG